MNMNPPPVRPVPTNPNYRRDHVGGSIAVVAAAVIAVFVSLGGFPTTKAGWGAVIGPCLIGGWKAYQSWKGADQAAPQK